MYLLCKSDVIRCAHNDVARELQCNSLLAVMWCLPTVPKAQHHSRSEHYKAKPTSLARKGKHHLAWCSVKSITLSRGYFLTVYLVLILTCFSAVIIAGENSAEEILSDRVTFIILQSALIAILWINMLSVLLLHM